MGSWGPGSRVLGGVLHGSARPFGRQLIKAGNDKIGNTGPDSIVDAAGSGDLDRSPAHGAWRCKILGGIVAHIGEGRWRKTIFRHDSLKAPPVRLPRSEKRRVGTECVRQGKIRR